MNITSTTRISAVLKENPEAIEAIASLSPAFEKLRNPVMRRVLAPRVTIAEAAKIGGVVISEFFKTLENIGFTTTEKSEENSFKNNDDDQELPTAACTLNANDFLQRGEDPLRTIQSTLHELMPGETLEIIANFAPSPLLRLMEKNGYTAKMVQRNEIWHTFITKPGKPLVKTETPEPAIRPDFQKKIASFKNQLVEIDVRQLPMPEPMIKILESAEDLEPGYALYIHHKRIPQHLLPELQARGFAWSLDDSGDEVKMLVWRKV